VDQPLDPVFAFATQLHQRRPLKEWNDRIDLMALIYPIIGALSRRKLDKYWVAWRVQGDPIVATLGGGTTRPRRLRRRAAV